VALSFQPFFPQSLQSISLANVAGANIQNVVQGGTNGTKIESLIISSNDSIDHALAFSLNVSGVYSFLCNVLISQNVGNSVGNIAFNLLGNTNFGFLPQDPNGNKYIYLANAACSLVVASNSLNSTAKVVTVSGQAAVF
jgi:hypothetical protein